MNKIKVVNDIIVLEDTNKNIEVKFENKNDSFDVNNITLKIKESCDIEIIYEALEKTKLDMYFYVYPNVSVNIFEVRSGVKTKVQYKYYIEENSSVTVNKFYYNTKHRELDIVNLNGEFSRFDYYLKTIAKDKEKYDFIINHNKSNTISNIYHHGINNSDEKLTFNVTGVVPKNKIGCELEQQSRIITNKDNENTIAPNLLIDEEDVSANHAALIGNFDNEEIFYMMSRGISYEDAKILLTNGFLLSGLREDNREKIKNILDTVWG